MAVLIAMFVGAAVALAPASLGQAAFESRQQAADRAARTGLAWATARLRSAPDWNATVVNTTIQPDFQIRESEGQVVGWIHEGERWNRFRIRFNWQDGPTSPSDGMNNPAQNWPDFTLVSSNNLRGASPKDIFQANGVGGSVTGSSPVRLKLPENSVLLSIEGTSGSVGLDATGNPTGFVGVPQQRTVEVVMRLSGPNQAVTPAAVMAAGDVALNLENAVTGQLDLAATATQATRLRTKGSLQVSQGGTPNVVSSKGELSANAISNITINGAPSNVGKVAENTGDGFYAIPYSDVKVPTSPALPPAGVYVVNNTGGITYYDMNFAAYQAAKSAGTLPAGTTATIPGIAMNTSGTSPKVRLTATQDLQVTPTGSATDFVIIPDGGAPTSNNQYDYSQATQNVQTYFQVYNTSWLNPPGSAGALPAWNSIFPDLPGVVQINSNRFSWTASNGATAELNTSSNQWTITGGWNTASAMDFAGAIASTLDPSNPNAAQNLTDYNYLAQTSGAPQYNPTAALPASTELIPSELQLTMQDPAGGSLVLKNDTGNLVLGSQVVGNGAALVSGKDIQLLGTSSQLSSTPSGATSLNIYAKGNVLVSTFKLDSTGAADFYKVDFKGVVYSWGNVTINVGDASVPSNKWGTMNMQGALVAFGGDPANPVPGYTGSGSAGKFTFSGKSARIQFDPSFLMGLYENLPQPLSMQIVSWHER
ncbi:hypothetical protein ABS71_06025 [bacterium SCN 62-11]|nr:MAG: hypothetical protein ABS71_06025 [bacterium SCN 62-11]